MKHPQCAICRDPRRHDIESELADGAQMRPLARKHEISYDSLWRHWRRHLTREQKDRLRFGDAPAHKLKGMVAEEEISVLKDLNFARRSLIEALGAAPATAAHARATLAGRLHENARIRGLRNGELAQSPLIQTNVQNNFYLQPEFAFFQANLIRALAPFADARAAVIREFELLESAAAPESLPALEAPHGEQTSAAE